MPTITDLRCPRCGHHREGDETGGCSSGYDMGFGDFDQCRCVDPCHREAYRDQRAL